MRYGLLGEKLKHSFSKDIHNLLGDYSYDLIEVSREELSSFIEAKEFSGLNVTIPYKEAVIPYLDGIDEAAKAIGAVNTIVNRNGRLYGYNTDFYGMEMLFSHAKVDPADKVVAILGSGGTSKTANAVARHLGAKEIIRVSREERDGCISYSALYERSGDIDIIVNTTPLGMFPDIDGCAVDISRFDRLAGVIDAVYNPLRTKLVIEAAKRNIRAEGGLYMLVAQAVRASEIFTNTKYDEKILEKVYRRILREKENIVLIGMPSSGKSTLAAILAKTLNRNTIDTDDEITKMIGMPIADYFIKNGESAFRCVESDVIHHLAGKTQSVIATGGGAVLKVQNVDALKQNGRLYFLDRALEDLLPTASRPLASSVEAIRQRYEERYDRYKAVADVTIQNFAAPEETANEIAEKHLKTLR